MKIRKRAPAIVLAKRMEPFPSVARPSQPWALGRNPFGILPRVPDSKDASKELPLTGALHPRLKLAEVFPSLRIAVALQGPRI